MPRHNYLVKKLKIMRKNLYKLNCSYGKISHTFNKFDCNLCAFPGMILVDIERNTMTLYVEERKTMPILVKLFLKHRTDPGEIFSSR